MSSFYKVKVQFEIEKDMGKNGIKTVKKNTEFLVKAVATIDAETIVATYLNGSTEAFEIISTQLTKFEDSI